MLILSPQYNLYLECVIVYDSQKNKYGSSPLHILGVLYT